MKNLFKFTWLIALFSSFIHFDMLAQTPKDFYTKKWIEVEKALQEGLPKTALEVVEKIYIQAKIDKNSAQQVKSLLHKMIYIREVEENTLVTSIIQFKKEIETAEYPVKPLLHSILAGIYWQYYEGNSWRFGQRTASDMKNDDIETWDLGKIVEECIFEYKKSLEKPELTQSVKIDTYDEIMHKGNELMRKNRPTLYDFLGHRAFNFFSTHTANLTQPAKTFLIDNVDYLADNQKFASLELKTSDNFSYKFYALKVLQDLTKFNLNSAESVKADLDLIRINFVYSNAVFQNKKKIYKECLEKMANTYQNIPAWSEFRVKTVQMILDEGSSYNPMTNPETKDKKKEAYNLCNEILAKFPKSEGWHIAKSIQNNLEYKSVRIEIESTVSVNTYFPVRIQYTNSNTLYWRIIQSSPEEYAKMGYNKHNYRENKEMVEAIRKAKTFKTWQTTLPDDKDYNTNSIEEKIAGLPSGYYVIAVSTKENFEYDKNSVSYQNIQVSDIAYLIQKQQDKGNQILVMNRNNSQPKANIKIEVWRYSYDYNKSKYETTLEQTIFTDKNGFALSAQKVKQNEYVNYFYKFYDAEAKDKLEETDKIHQEYYNGTEPEIIQNFVHIFTDRNIYRPSQVVYFKALVMQSNNRKSKILTNKNIRAIFTDVNGQLIKDLDLVSNEFGSVSGKFTIPATGLTGQMTISFVENGEKTVHKVAEKETLYQIARNYNVTLDAIKNWNKLDNDVIKVGQELIVYDARNSVGLGQNYIRVEEYKRPKFEVTFENLKGVYKVNDEILVKGFAKAYSGANIDGANLKYRIKRSAKFPTWFYYYRGYYPSSPEQIISFGEAKTNEKGEFLVKFNAIPDLDLDESTNPTFNYEIEVDVTDQNGETRSGETNVKIGYQALNLTVNVPENINPTTKNEWKINVQNLNGQPEKASVKVIIHQLTTPEKAYKVRYWTRTNKYNYSKTDWHKDLPNDMYEDENNHITWKKSTNVLEKIYEVEENTFISPEKLKEWKEGKYIIEASLTDKFGKVVKDIQYFEVRNQESNKIHLPILLNTYLPKSEGKANDKINIFVNSSEKNVNVLFEVEFENKILHKEWIKVSNEQKKLTYVVPANAQKGSIYIRLTSVLYNRTQLFNAAFNIINKEKDLDISFETFRDKLQPGEKEKWRVKIKGEKGEKVAAEMVANLYDASLDALGGAHQYNFSVDEVYYGATNWLGNTTYNMENFIPIESNWNIAYGYSSIKDYDYLNMYGLSFDYYSGRRYKSYNKKSKNRGEVEDESYSISTASPTRAVESKLAKEEAPKKSEDKVMADAELKSETVQKPLVKKEKTKETADLTNVKARVNFNETAFFYPHLKTDAEGNIIIEFTIPESLTKWKMLGFAHTQDLKYGLTEKTLVTQKDLMVVPNAPRFLREDDKIIFQSKITNISDKDLTGSAQLFLSNPLNTKSLDNELDNNNAQQSFTVPKGQSTVVSWALKIPIGMSAVTYKVVAKAGNFSDGEEMTLPILTNRMLVTETMPLPIRGKQEKKFEMPKLLTSANSSTLKHEKLTVEFTSNPAWYAVQALPYMMEYPYECAEQVFSRFYANSLATHIANSSPKIQQTFETWKNLTPEAFLSNLDKNQELKNTILEETPWLRNANNDSERKRQIGVLFDLVRMAKEQKTAIEKLEKKQVSSGGFVWFEGMPEDRYVTQHIACGIGHLNKLNIKSVQENANIKAISNKAVMFLDKQMQKDYDDLVYNCKKYNLKLEDQHISYFQVHYLYMRSFFEQKLDKSYQKAFDYYKGQAQKYWLKFNRYSQGMIALALHRLNDKVIPQAIIKSLKEKALNNEEMGMYWKDSYGFYWYEAPIETHALMIELFSEVAKDEKIVDDLKTWLLKQKQTQDWKTTKATAEACYALLLQGKDWLSQDVTVQIQLGDKRISNAPENGNVTAEAGTGYFKTAFNKEEVKADMGKITVSKNAEGVAWGAVYWQYFENLDKITPAKTPLAIKKQLFIEKDTDKGKLLTEITAGNTIKVGDLVKVRVEIKVDRAMEYVHLKDMRASGFEPIASLSGYRWQDGLGYYESPRDAAMNFFIGYLPKGTFVFEYSLRAMQSGDFSNGITQIQCMYAPEFTSISEGIRVKIEK